MAQENITLWGKQVGKFTIVGIINTLIDVAVLNFLVLILNFKYKIYIFGFSYLVANIISVTVAMVNSYLLNKYWTFKSGGKRNLVAEIVKFFFITILGMYVIHQIVFNFFNSYWLWPTLQIINLFHLIKITHLDNFITLNFAKLLAILVSMIWNFLFYKFWVFKK